MLVRKNHVRAWLPLVALFLSILTTLLPLDGAQGVTQARSYPLDGLAEVEPVIAPAAPPAQACVPVPGERFCSYLPLVGRSFRYAHLVVSKTASPATVMTTDNEEIVYTVTVHNAGDTAGQLTGARDLLPAGFTFVDMAADSEIKTLPSVTGQELAWLLPSPITMAPGEQKRLIYRTTHSAEVGAYTNSVTVSATLASVPIAPAQATVTVEPGILVEDHFESDTRIGRWTPFLNHPRLAEGQWYWGATDGYGGSGALTMNRYAVSGKDAHDGLMMYMADGAEAWTDYRMEANIVFRTEGQPSGLWVRGQWEPSGIDGQWVTGYYAVVGGKADGETHYVRLLQLQTLEDCWGPPCPSDPAYIPGREINLYNYNNPHDLTDTERAGTLVRGQWYTIAVEVRGANIKIWLNGELYIDYTDPKEPFLTGTVGFKTYSADTVSFDDVVVTALTD